MALRSSLARAATIAFTSMFVLSSSFSPSFAQPTWPSGMSCFYRDRLATLESWRGSRFGALHGWANGDTWKNMLTFFSSSLRNEFVARRQSGPRVIAISTPLFPTEATGRFAACARGDYDVHIRGVAQRLQWYNARDAIIRLGWEADGTWFHWSIRGDFAGYKACFRRWATVLKSVEPRVQIEWAINRQVTVQKAQALIANAYPGHDVVDIIGFSFYDHWPSATSSAVWNSRFAPELAFWVNFATANRKKLAFGEWGIGDRRGGGFDNPLYIQNMYNFFRANQNLIAYESYFNCGPVDKGFVLNPESANPRSAALYKSLW